VSCGSEASSEIALAKRKEREGGMGTRTNPVGQSAVALVTRPPTYRQLADREAANANPTCVEGKVADLKKFFANVSKFIANSFEIHRSLFSYSDLRPGRREKVLPSSNTTMLSYLAWSNCLRECQG
jgi:hypothetical protein